MNKRPTSNVPLQTELRFHLRRYEQPHSIGGPAERQKTDERHAVTRSSSGDDDDFCSGGPNSGNADLRVDAAVRRPPPVPKLVRQGRAEGRRRWRSARGRPRLSRRRKNLFQLPWQTPAPRAAPKPLASEDRERCSCHRHGQHPLLPPSLSEGAGHRPRRGRPQLSTLPSPTPVMKILEAEVVGRGQGRVRTLGSGGAKFVVFWG